MKRIVLLTFVLITIPSFFSMMVEEVPAEKVEISMKLKPLGAHLLLPKGTHFASVFHYLALGAYLGKHFFSDYQGIAVRAVGNKQIGLKPPSRLADCEIKLPFISCPSYEVSSKREPLLFREELHASLKLRCVKAQDGYIISDDTALGYTDWSYTKLTVAEFAEKKSENVRGFESPHLEEFTHSAAQAEKVSLAQALAFACRVPRGSLCFLSLQKGIPFHAVQLVEEADKQYRLRLFRNPELCDNVWEKKNK